MHRDDSTIDLAVCPGDLVAYGSASDARPENCYPFVRALMIGLPLALLMWAGIVFAVFRAVVQS